ncbi:MAG: ribonuclease III [Magnetococcales bacterium]|nr:ribonuclease III [Magnetococcales bacterium]
MNRDEFDPETLTAWFSEHFDYTFNDPGMLRLALTHRSVAQDDTLEPAPLGAPDEELPLRHNERLEFLGDAVLDLAVSRLLFHRFPDAPEGELSHWRAALVNTRALGQMGRELGLGSRLRLGRGEDLSGGRDKPSILGNSIEALFGAVFLDGGWPGAERMAAKVFAARMERFSPGGELKDFKTALQERLQGMARPLPRYALLGVSGPPHQRHFQVACRVDEGIVGRGDGPSKRRAEQEAARHAMELMERIDMREENAE